MVCLQEMYRPYRLRQGSVDACCAVLLMCLSLDTHAVYICVYKQKCSMIGGVDSGYSELIS